MNLTRFYDDKLAQASYLIGCAATGEALVVDPHRDVTPYLEAAASEGLRITHVTETHIHADFVSGSRELAARTGATLYLSDEGDADWKYAFAAEDEAVLLRDGDTFDVGNVRIEAVHTPGHTPEHLSFLVTDTPASDQPLAILTGDFVFVGDVGRPDLLEKAAKVEGTMESAARTLFHALQRFKEYPDHLQILPGHGAGSACGKGIGSVPSSTVGYERLANWAFQVEDEDAFVAAVLEGQPEPPTYFAEMKRINKEGPPVLGGFSRPDRLDARRIMDLLDEGVAVVDTRPADAYAESHVPGTLNIPLNQSFPTWAGWLLSYEEPIHLLVDESEEDAVDEAVRDLSSIGLDQVAGWCGVEALDAWTEAGRSLDSVPRTNASELAGALERGEVTVVDVRGRSEWEAGHLPGVDNIPVGYLEEHLEELPRDEPLVVQCQSGGRSAIAASLLRAHGMDNVVNLDGGYEAWVAEGGATVTTPEPGEASSEAVPLSSATAS